MRIYLIVVFVVFLNLNLHSQSYFTSAGARFGTDWGITIQQRVWKHATVEGIFQSSLFREELMLTGLLEHHFPVISKRLNIYAGAGFHKGFNTQDSLTYQSPYGITAIAGAEFTIARFTISYDYKPAFNLYGGENNWYNQSALSVRYVIVPQHAIKKIQRERERKERREERREKFRDIFRKK